jgi:AcrR family transcriptional regulator
MSRKPARKASRPQLSAERIAAAALSLVDAQGLEGLSYRILAKSLACEAMSLYHYYPSKAHLLDAMANICIAEVSSPPQELPWKEGLRYLARDYRKMALRHPGFYPFIAIYRMNSHNGLEMLNHVLSIFEGTGLGVEARARHFRVFGYFLTGACLDETVGYAKGPSAANPVPFEEAQRLFPAIMSVGSYFAKDQHERTFEMGLDVMIAQIESDATAGQPR